MASAFDGFPTFDELLDVCRQLVHGAIGPGIDLPLFEGFDETLAGNRSPMGCRRGSC